MYKFIIKLADLKIYIHCHYQYCFNMCQDYIVNDKDYDFKISTKDFPIFLISCFIIKTFKTKNIAINNTIKNK